MKTKDTAIQQLIVDIAYSLAGINFEDIKTHPENVKEYVRDISNSAALLDDLLNAAHNYNKA